MHLKANSQNKSLIVFLSKILFQTNKHAIKIERNRQENKILNSTESQKTETSSK